jgi:hypothetical protein
MTKKKLSQVEAKLMRACKKARAAGYRLARGEFYRPAEGRRRPRCCPIGALCGISIASDPNLVRAEKALGIGELEIWEIIEGVDDGTPAAPGPGAWGREFYQLGVRLCRRLRIPR